MRTAGLTLDDHMLYTIFIDTLPAEYEVEVRNLASRDSIGHDDVIKVLESGTTDFLETGRRGPTLAMLAMLCSPPPPAVVAAGKAAAAMAAGKAAEAAATKEVDVGESTDEAAKAPTRSVVARPRLPAAIASAPKPPKVVPTRRGATGVARRAIGGPTARRRYEADAKDGGTLQMSAPRPQTSDAAVARDGDTLLIPAPRRNRKLC